MIYFATALNVEAKTVIRKLGLKLLPSSGFRMYTSENIRLIITGTGKIRSAIGVTHMLSAELKPDDSVLVNIGFAGTADRTKAKGSLWLINRITDAGTGLDFFPDIIHEHAFGECGLITADKPVIVSGNGIADDCLFDMEASGCYQAGIKYLKTHQMFFFKIISDYGEGNRLNENELNDWCESSMDRISDFIIKTHEKMQENSRSKYFSHDPELLIVRQNLKLTETQYHQLKEAVIACQIRHKRTTSLLSKYSQTVVCNPNERDRLFRKIIHDLSE